MRKLCLLSLAVVLTSVMGTAAAQSATDDILAMVKAGVNEEVLMAYVDTSPFGYLLTPAEIIQLKDAKVSDHVVLAMLHHRSAPVTQVPASQVQPVSTPAPEPAPAYTPPQREYTYQPERVVEPAAQTVVYESSSYPSYYSSYPYSYAYYPYSYYPYSGLYFGVGYGGYYGNCGWGHSCWGGSHGFHNHGSVGFSGGFGVSGFASSHGSFGGTHGSANFSSHGGGGVGRR